MMKPLSLYSEIFDKASDGIFVIDTATGDIIEVNNKACQITGYSKQQMLKMRTGDSSSQQPGFTREDGLQKIKMAATNGDQIFEWQLRHKHSGIRWVEVNLTVTTIGSRQCAVAFFHEIAERKSAELKLEEERSRGQKEIMEAVIAAEEKERQEIGRELHDNVKQILGTSLLYLGMAKKCEDGKTHPHLDEMNKLINMAIEELRNLSHSMISPFVEDYGLINALDYLLHTTSKTTGLNINTRFNNIHEDLLSNKLKISVYRIAQEQLNNIIKYAKATRVEFTLLQTRNSLTLGITDDGVGFDPQQQKSGVGLKNIRTRAAIFNGEMKLNTAPGKGCELKATMVVAPPCKNTEPVLS